MFALLYRYVLGSHLNKSALGIASHLSGCLFQRETTRGSSERRGLQIGRCHVSYVVRWWSAVFCPYRIRALWTRVGFMCHLAFIFFPVPFFKKKKKKFKGGATKGSLKCSHPTHPNLPPPLLTLEEYSRRLNSQVKNVYANAGYTEACTGC